MTPSKPGSQVAKEAAARLAANVRSEADGAPSAPAPPAASRPARTPPRRSPQAAATATAPAAATGRPATNFPAAAAPAPTAPVAPPRVAAPAVAGSLGAGAAGPMSDQDGARAARAARQARSSSPGPATSGAPVSGTGRRVRLTVSRVDAWSVFKISLLISVAIGIALVVMVAVLWLILDGMGVFTSVNRTISDVAGSTSTFDLMDYIALPKVLSIAGVIGVVDVILLTALSTLAGFLYNVCSSLVGGVQLTLTDD